MMPTGTQKREKMRIASDRFGWEMEMSDGTKWRIELQSGMGERLWALRGQRLGDDESFASWHLLRGRCNGLERCTWSRDVIASSGEALRGLRLEPLSRRHMRTASRHTRVVGWAKRQRGETARVFYTAGTTYSIETGAQRFYMVPMGETDGRWGVAVVHLTGSAYLPVAGVWNDGLLARGVLGSPATVNDYHRRLVASEYMFPMRTMSEQLGLLAVV